MVLGQSSEEPAVASRWGRPLSKARAGAGPAEDKAHIMHEQGWGRHFMQAPTWNLHLPSGTRKDFLIGILNWSSGPDANKSKFGGKQRSSLEMYGSELHESRRQAGLHEESTDRCRDAA